MLYSFSFSLPYSSTPEAFSRKLYTAYQEWPLQAGNTERHEHEQGRVVCIQGLTYRTSINTLWAISGDRSDTRKPVRRFFLESSEADSAGLRLKIQGLGGVIKEKTKPLEDRLQ